MENFCNKSLRALMQFSILFIGWYLDQPQNKDLFLKELIINVLGSNFHKKHKTFSVLYSLQKL